MIVLAPYYALRGWRRGEPHETLRQRFGILPADMTRMETPAGSLTGAEPLAPIWIHAVSVGEVLAAKSLVDALKGWDPARQLFLSTTTETGQRLARERVAADRVFYFPFDWIVPVRWTLRGIRPAIVIVMETEIWPNFLREARRMGIPVVFANARISGRSFERFRRWQFLVGPFFAQALQDAELFLAQTSDDADRLREMGAGEERVEVIGNLKFDAEPPAVGPFGKWLEGEILGQERWPILVAGSVVEGEEGPVLAAYDLAQRKWNHALLVLAPRKPGRFDAAAEVARAAGWNVVRRSKLTETAQLDENADVLLLDSIGELAGIYALADAVFVGGSLVNSGGHNILEPAWFARPPIFGTSMENFREMADMFLDSNAGIQVNSGTMLGKAWVQLIEDGPLRKRMGQAARAISERNRGATAKTLERIEALLAELRETR